MPESAISLSHATGTRKLQFSFEAFYRGIKGTVSRDFFASDFFHESSSPKSLKTTLGSFRIILKIRRDNRKSRCTIAHRGITAPNFAAGTDGVINTGGK
jgi:hypothetical protein